MHVLVTMWYYKGGGGGSIGSICGGTVRGLNFKNPLTNLKNLLNFRLSFPIKVGMPPGPLSAATIINTDEDPGLWIESFVVINLHSVSTNKTIYPSLLLLALPTLVQTIQDYMCLKFCEK